MKSFSSKKNSYWFFLHPFVYSNVKKNKAIFYNTMTGKLLTYDYKQELFRFIRKLLSDENLYVVKVIESGLHPAVTDFMNEIRDNFMGDKINTKNRAYKPIQMKPILSLQKHIEQYTMAGTDNEVLAHDDLKKYIDTISIYLNNRCMIETCNTCTTAHRQFAWCTKKKPELEELPLEIISKILAEVQHSKLVKIDLLGGDILSYSKLPDLVQLLNGFPFIRDYNIHYLNMKRDDKFLSILESGFSNRLTILVDFPIDEIRVIDCINILRQVGIHKRLSFAITSTEQLNEAEQIAKRFNIDDYIFNPFYNGENIDFFEKNVFFGIEDILEEKPSMKEILSRAAINTLNFKKLFVLSNGKLYANLNHRSFGKLPDDSVYNQIYKEINQGKSWRKVRKNIVPCKSCVFNLLCPPISNYEYAFGKYNLCQIYKGAN